MTLREHVSAGRKDARAGKYAPPQGTLENEAYNFGYTGGVLRHTARRSPEARVRRAGGGAR